MSLLTSWSYDTNYGSQQTAMLEAQEEGMSSLSMGNLGTAFGKMSPWLAVAGAVQSAVGSYYSAKSQQSNLRFQQQMAGINARGSEMQAEAILEAGNREIGRYTMKAGQVKSSSKAAMAARGITGGVGSAQEVIASQDLVKEIDALTINANAVRAAGAARTQSTNYLNQGLLAGTSASSISPFMSLGTSLLGSATSIGSNWLRSSKIDDLLSRLNAS